MSFADWRHKISSVAATASSACNTLSVISATQVIEVIASPRLGSTTQYNFFSCRRNSAVFEVFEGFFAELSPAAALVRFEPTEGLPAGWDNAVASRCMACFH